MGQRKQYSNIRLKPHLEIHGLRGIEWSYHFPLESDLRITAELQIQFPEEKVPGSAKASLMQADLATTRLSFADLASEVRVCAADLYNDSRWIKKNVHIKDFGTSIDLDKINTKNAFKFYAHHARTYWTWWFFARMGVALQSDFKQCLGKIEAVYNNYEISNGINWQELNELNKELCSIFRSCSRIVATLLTWEEIFYLKTDKHALPFYVQDVTKFYKQLKDLTELAIVSATKTIAELQEKVCLALKVEEDAIKLIQGGVLEGYESYKELKQSLIISKTKLVHQQAWLAEWARIVSEWRMLCGLKPLAEIVRDQDAAAIYFERIRELMRLHYQTWELNISLELLDTRLDFYIGAWAAGISAAFAFLAAYLTFIMFKWNTNLQDMSILLLGFFAVSQIIIYVLKDRMKEWIKLKLKKGNKFNFGKHVGYAKLPTELIEESGEEEPNVAYVERMVAWKSTATNLVFDIWEQFRVLEKLDMVQASIAKQVWVIPLDEILDTLDNAKHTLKIPSFNGIPQEIPVLKRNAFPYSIKVSVKREQEKSKVSVKGKNKNIELILLDQVNVKGRIVCIGDKISFIETQ